MANLESKGKMSPWQLGLVVTSGLLSARLLLATNQFVYNAQQFAWLSSALAGLLFYFAAYLMIRLGEEFPQETVGEYVTRLLGKAMGTFVFAVFITVLLLNIINCTVAVTAVYSIYLFDQTPRGALILVLLMAVVYCVMQNWGTILRIVQTLIFALPLLYIFYSLIWINFDALNLLPLWPDDFAGIVRAVAYHTDYFAGYEAVLVLLPLATLGKTSYTRTVGWGFIVVTFMYVLGAVAFVGSITAKTGASVPTPVIYAMKSVELPGTFIERLENYMITLFFPVTYVSMVISYFAVVEGCRKFLSCSEHRTFVPFFLPLIFFVCYFADSPERRETLRLLDAYIVFFFSFLITPSLLILAKRMKGRDQGCREE